LAFCMAILPFIPLYAASAPPLPNNAALDLGSRARTFTAPNARLVDLRLGPSIVPIRPGQAITPAEYLAIMQLYVGHSQGLVLNFGSLSIAKSGLLSGSLPLTLPLHNSSSAAGLDLNVAGDLQNLGRILSPGTLSITVGGTFTNQGTIGSQGTSAIAAGSGRF